ncbi:phage tail protein [Dyella sp. 20L07]|uniref:phage tail protein n=1 Tax=Dyella sp. 20L07 TaxID=3384240 RepID=UPI003D2C0A63
MQPYVGEIRLLPFTYAPVGWQDCDGSLLSISDNEALYTLIGTTYGGDGQRTFGVPDLRGRIPVHMGTGAGLSPYVLGQIAGYESITLTTGQTPAHTHTVSANTTLATTGTPSGNQLGAISGDTLYTSDITGLTPVPIASTMIGIAGGSQPHDNTMPTLTMRFCISLFGTFPTQS